MCLAAILAAVSPCAALDEPGVTAAPILQIPMGSRALGMGGAFTAVADDPSALHYNPAGLSRLNAHEVSAAFLSGQADNHHQHFAYGGPLPFAGITGEGFSSAGGSVLYSRNGDLEINELAADGSIARSATISAGYDVVVSGGYSERVGATPIDTPVKAYTVNHFIGLAGKMIYSSLAEQYSATAVAADAGYLVQCPELGLSVGMAAANVGSKMRYLKETDPLPMTFRLGAAYNVKPAPLHTLTLAADSDFMYYERLWHAALGMEYFWNRNFGFRLGYQFNRQTLGITAGLGMRWRTQFSMDYAWALGASVSDTHRITLSYRFGGVIPSARVKARRPFMEVSPGRESLPVGVGVSPEPVPEPSRREPAPREERPSGVPGWIY